MIPDSVSGGFMYAILRAGGKQVKVSPGDVIRMERPAGKAFKKGEPLDLTEVVLAGGEGTEPKLSGVTVKATVLGEVKARKVIVFKKKRRKQYRRTKGHRQRLLSVRIDGIEG
jgi:large subunit ribosomal protein L21